MQKLGNFFIIIAPDMVCENFLQAKRSIPPPFNLVIQKNKRFGSREQSEVSSYFHIWMMGYFRLGKIKQWFKKARRVRKIGLKGRI